MALTDNLTAYYKFDDSGTIVDSHGSFTGTNNGATFTATALIGSAYDFDGAGDNIELGASNSLMSNTGLTLSFWVNIDVYGSGSDSDIFFCAHEASTPGAAFYGTTYDNPSGRIQFTWDDGSSTTDFVDQNGYGTGTWIHICVTYDGTNVKGYINGTDHTVSGTRSFVGLGSHPLTIGFYYNGWGSTTRSLNGKIDEVGTWTRALSSSEVSELYNSGSGLAYPFTGDTVFNSVEFGHNF